MPEFTVAHIAILALLFAVGALLGWVMRSDRCTREKIAANAGWQEQLEGQQTHQRRLAEQNRKLKQRLSEFQASHKDSQQRARDLTDTLKQAVDRRDELNRQLKDVRSSLQSAVAERDRLRSDARSKSGREDASARALRDKDSKIFKLSRELTSWQGRLPPLVEKFRARDLEVRELRAQLRHAEERIQELEARPATNNTRIEPLEPGALTSGLNASNEQYGVASSSDPQHIGSGIGTAPRAPGEAPAGVADTPGRESLQEGPQEGYDPAFPAPSRLFAHATNSESRDDLQKIKGVGPAIERTLNDCGIFRFEQIADISEFDIDRVAKQLKGFRSRIYREDWIGQAQALRHSGYHRH